MITPATGESKADRLEKLNPAHGRTRAPSVENESATVAAEDVNEDIVDPSRRPSMHGTATAAPQPTAVSSSTETPGAGGKAVWSPSSGGGGGGRKQDWSSRKDPCDNCCNCCCDGIKDTWCACPGAAWLNIVSVFLLMLCMLISIAVFIIHSVPVIPAIINAIGGDTFKLGECAAVVATNVREALGEVRRGVWKGRVGGWVECEREGSSLLW